jgi:hypothetical protein
MCCACSRKSDGSIAPGPRHIFCRYFWQSLGGRTIRIGSATAKETNDAFIDVDGQYTKLMDEYGCNAIVKRPGY